MDKFEEMLWQELDDMVDEEMKTRERESYNQALEDLLTNVTCNYAGEISIKELQEETELLKR